MRSVAAFNAELTSAIMSFAVGRAATILGRLPLKIFILALVAALVLGGRVATRMVTFGTLSNMSSTRFPIRLWAFATS